MHVDKNDILGSFDTLELLKDKFSVDIVNLITWHLHILSGGARFMNSFHESFQQDALRTEPYQLKHWFRYVDNTFVIWLHGEGKLNKLLGHLNTNIKLTTKRS